MPLRCCVGTARTATRTATATRTDTLSRRQMQWPNWLRYVYAAKGTTNIRTSRPPGVPPSGSSWSFTANNTEHVMDARAQGRHDVRPVLPESILGMEETETFFTEKDPTHHGGAAAIHIFPARLSTTVAQSPRRYGYFSSSTIADTCKYVIHMRGATWSVRHLN